jgi:hypothetical protein
LVAITAILLASFIALSTPAAAATPAVTVPEGWQAFKINDKKKLTAYRLVEEDGRQVLHSHADGSASGVYQPGTFNLAERPIMSWSWKINRLIPGADNRKSGSEDSPARIVMVFEGDKEKLPRSDRTVMYLAHQLSGQQLPYATLMYIWSNDVPVGTVIPNPHTRRIQMVVASSGATGVGAWQKLSRNVADDFRRAFKEEPGRLLAYGVMSDTDNTGQSVEAWYGQIHLESKKTP